LSWQRLGVYSVTSGTLAVGLSDAANGYVIADAVRVAPATPQPPTVGSLSATPSPVVTGKTLTLTAAGVSAPAGTVTRVDFYRDTNGNGQLDVGTDALLGTDTNG